MSSAASTPDMNSTTFGATSIRELSVTARDGSLFKAQVYNTINLSTHEDLLGQLVEGKLTTVEDTRGIEYPLAIPVLCHDEQRGRLILFLPEVLRHEELRYRRQLLEDFEKQSLHLPSYARSFSVAFGTKELQALLNAPLPGEQTAITASPFEEVNAQALVEKEQEIDALKLEVEGLREDLDKKRVDEDKSQREREEALARREAELRKKEEELRREESRIQNLAAGFEKESASVQDVHSRVQKERAHLEEIRKELEEERRRVQVLELNLEQERLRLQQVGPDTVNESTQVVTDDQFIEIISDEKNVASPPRPVLSPSESDAIPTLFFEVADDDEANFVLIRNGELIAGYLLDDARAATFVENEARFFFQLHQLDGVPLSALTLVALKGEDALDAIAAGLHTIHPAQAALLKELEAGVTIHVALYDSSGDLITAREAARPTSENVSWARQQMKDWERRTGPRAREVADQALASLAQGTIELWGAMRHPFHDDSFSHLESASEVQLAAGIVEYWSQPEQILYLIGNRAFPHSLFVDIQKRVVRQALHWGIAPGEQLRRLAIEAAIIPDLRSLTQRLLANYTEVCVGVRPNDLDAIEQWENWEALISLSQAQGVAMDPAMVELAEISLKRANEEGEHSDDHLNLSSNQGDGEVLGDDDLIEELDLDDLVVSRHSEKTGVTYFLPDEEVIDTFEDLASMEQEDLLILLLDDHGRLEAAQVLVERFGSTTLPQVLEALEDFNAAELAALTRFVEVRADGLEAALMQGLERGGPNCAYLTARALAGLGTTAALPRLLQAQRDDHRRGPGRQLARALARYGEKLLPTLTKELRKTPEDLHLLSVLSEVEKLHPGTIQGLKKERSKELQKAASLAAKM